MEVLPGNKWKAPAASWCGNPALCQNLPDSCNQAAAIWGQPLKEMQGTKSYKIRVPPAIRIRVNALRGHPLGVASKILGAPFFSSRRASLQIRSKQCKNQFQTRSAFAFEKFTTKIYCIIGTTVFCLNWQFIVFVCCLISEFIYDKPELTRFEKKTKNCNVRCILKIGRTKISKFIFSFKFSWQTRTGVIV